MHRKPKILVTEPEYFTPASLALMRRVGTVVAKRMPYRELLRAAEDVDALVVRIEAKLDRKLIDKAVRLKCVATATTGTNHIDVSHLARRGIPLFALHDVHSVSTAEHALGLLFAASRNIPHAHARMAHGHWKRWEHIGTELAGKTIGIFGIGKIGAAVARRAAALGMRAVAYDPYVSGRECKRRGAQKTSWRRFLKQSDCFSLHAPLTNETKGIFGARAFKAMKPGAIFVNTARGAFVEQKALLDALAKKKIRAAAIDVYEEEPLSPRDPLRKYARTHGNLILTPHLGASTREAISRASMHCAKAIVKYFGKKNRNAKPTSSSTAVRR